RRSDVERLPAAALALDVGVVEAKALVKAFLHEVDLGALDVAQALRVDEDTDPVARELEIALLDRVGEVELVREPRATGRAHAEPQAEALAPAREETADVVRGGRGESDARSHAFRSCLFEWPATGPSLRRWSAGRCSA